MYTRKLYRKISFSLSPVRLNVALFFITGVAFSSIIFFLLTPMGLPEEEIIAILLIFYSLIISTIVFLQAYIVKKTVKKNKNMMDRAVRNEIVLREQCEGLKYWQESMVDSLQEMIVTLKSFEENNATKYIMVDFEKEDETLRTLVRYINLNLQRQVSALKIVKMLTQMKDGKKESNGSK